MKLNTPEEIDRILEEGTLVDLALIRAAKEAARVHRHAGLPLVVARDGKPAYISPEEYERELENAERKLKDKN